MITSGIYKLVFGHTNPESFNFCKDAGMLLESHFVWTALNGSKVEIIHSDTIGLVSVVWASDTDFEFVDINGIRHVFSSSAILTEVNQVSTKTNTYTDKVRINEQISIEDTTVPCAIAHVALFTEDIYKSSELFKNVGFVVSDMIKDKCIFMRSKPNNPHHQILLAQSVEKKGMQHVAFSVSDIYTVFTKGLNMASKGYTTLLGPGRHVISSSIHWYFNTDLGAFEFSCDEDYLTSDWQPNIYDPNNSIVYEWAIENGIDPCTRRQKGIESVSKFIDQRIK